MKRPKKTRKSARTRVLTAARKAKAFDHRVDVMHRDIVRLHERAAIGIPGHGKGIPGVLNDLQSTLEELQAADEELRMQNMELAAAQQNILEEQQRYRDLFEFAPDGCVITDMSGNIKEANRAVTEMLNVAPKALMDMPLASFVAVEDRKRLRHELAHLAGRRSIRQLDLRILRRKAGDFPASVKLALSQAPDKPSRVQWMIRDISVRKQAQAQAERATEALRHASLYTRSLLEASLDPLVTISPEGKITDVNRATEIATGLPRKQLIGSDFADYFTQPEKARKGYREVLSRGLVFDYPLTLRHVSGRTTDVIYNASVYRNEAGDVEGVFAAARDVTEREQTRKAIEISEARYRALMEESTEAIIVADADGRILEVNPSLTRILGYEPRDAIGRNLASFVEEDDLKLKPLRLKEASAGEALTADRRVRRKDGLVIDFETTSKALADGRLLIIGRDVTQRKQAQERLRMYQARLKSMATELSLVEERQRRQIAVELHDRIGQDLAVSKMKLGALKASIGDGPTGEALAEIFSMIDQSLQDTRTLTFDLCPPILHDLGLEQALAYLVEEFGRQHGIKAVFENDGTSKPLDENLRTVLYRAARELLVNTAKHAGAKNVKVSLRRVRHDVRLTVEDDGVGFDASVIRAGVYPEGGFGLFSIREQLGYLGGFFDIESTPGRGTRAVLTATLAPKERTRGKTI